jgi:hypothetical protein
MQEGRGERDRDSISGLEKWIDANVESGRWPDPSSALLNDRLTLLEQALLDESALQPSAGTGT